MEIFETIWRGIYSRARNAGAAHTKMDASHKDSVFGVLYVDGKLK